MAENWPVLVTTYAVIVLAALLLGVAGHSLRYVFVALMFCGAHALLVGPAGRVCLSPTGGKALAVGALAFALVETRVGSVHVSYGLAHFLMLVQLIKLYGPHRSRDLRLIQVAAVFEGLVAGVWALDVIYLPVFILTGLALMANFIALEMLPEARPLPDVRPLTSDRAGAWGDLLSAMWLPAAGVFGCTVLLFILLPRVRVAWRDYELLPGQVTSFSEIVSLHEVGRLRESEQVALRVGFWEEGAPMQFPLELPHVLMRGVSRPFYRDGQWFGYSAASRLAPSRAPDVVPPPVDEFTLRSTYRLEDVEVRKRVIQQKVSPESRPSRTVFALYRPVKLEGLAPYGYTIPSLSHDATHPRALEPAETYVVLSVVPEFAPDQLREAGTARPTGRWSFFWDIPEDIRSTLEGTAAQIGRIYSPGNDYDRVIAAQSYLLDPHRFTYTYDLPEFGDKEPIEAFLTETHRGSCEQFSTALALILRVWEIPTRLVVGFKDGEFDYRTGGYIFRDKHAHAWVEVYFNGLGWVEFDPTPGAAIMRERATGLWSSFDRFVARIRGAAMIAYVNAGAKWHAGVIGYNRSRQERVLSGLSEAAGALVNGISGFFVALWTGLPSLGWVQVAVLALLLALAVMLVYFLAARLLRRIRWRWPGGRSGRTLSFYEELLSLLRRKGLRRPAHATPREFARTAVAQLAAANEDNHEMLRSIGLVTDLYYRVRFGGYELTESQRRQVREALRVLATARRARPADLSSGSGAGV